MYNLSNLTIIIVTFLTNRETLSDCLNSIDKSVKVIIVENSIKFRDRHFFLNRFNEPSELSKSINTILGSLPHP